MTIIDALLLGIVEGITEFLPVSSTAHLIVAQRLLGLDPSVFFTTVIQLGAIAAVIVYFHKKLWKLALESLRFMLAVGQQKVKVTPDNLPLGLTILVASLPVFIVGYVLRHSIEGIHNSLSLIALTSIGVGIILWFAQRRAARVHNTHIRAQDIITMGFYQILSLIPGTSRSGIVIAGGLLSGLSFATALEYSFYMSVPALVGAGVYELVSMNQLALSQEIVTATILATCVSFVSALLMIHLLLSVVRRVGFTPFIIYRILFGIGILFLR
jgi:undecaprenyl-diphosphatase